MAPSLVILITMWAWAFYVFYGIVEIVLTGLVVWYALTWPGKWRRNIDALSVSLHWMCGRYALYGPICSARQICVRVCTTSAQRFARPLPRPRDS
jgi:hypothetical protein